MITLNYFKYVNCESEQPTVFNYMDIVLSYL